jgi:hypothetical protein
MIARLETPSNLNIIEAAQRIKLGMRVHQKSMAQGMGESVVKSFRLVLNSDSL